MNVPRKLFKMGRKIGGKTIGLEDLRSKGGAEKTNKGNRVEKEQERAWKEMMFEEKKEKWEEKV